MSAQLKYFLLFSEFVFAEEEQKCFQETEVGVTRRHCKQAVSNQRKRGALSFFVLFG